MTSQQKRICYLHGILGGKESVMRANNFLSYPVSH